METLFNILSSFSPTSVVESASLVQSGLYGGTACAIAIFAMVLAQRLIYKLKITDADMTLILGSLAVRDEKHAFYLGVLFQFVIGFVLTFLYGFGFKLLVTNQNLIPVLGAVCGGLHGLLFAWVAMTLLADYQTVRSFRKLRMEDAIAMIVGHIVFGTTLGTLYRLNLSFTLDLDAFWKFDTLQYFGGIILIIGVFMGVASFLHRGSGK